MFCEETVNLLGNATFKCSAPAPDILSSAEYATYGIIFAQAVRGEPGATYDLSVWVRGIDLVSAVATPHGYGQHCGFTFWVYGPGRKFEHRKFGSSSRQSWSSSSAAG